MKSKINLFYIFICFLIYISPIGCEEKAITITLKGKNNNPEEYKIISPEFINDIKEILSDGTKIDQKNSTLKLQLSPGADITIKIIFNNIKANCSEMFKDCKDIESINLSEYDMSSVSIFKIN